MKKRLVLAALLAGTLAAGSAYASPCDSFMCMAGKVQGGAGSSCNSAINDFFGIIKWHHGHLDKGATSDARRSFLKQCPGTDQPANAAMIDTIISQFGAVQL
ncbi:MAG: TrbM/KikA/MpfK family conjugal transfer protein (plasmid) [Burkholderia sp.]|nr:MAG: hypothetical protein E5299_01972 [Burkholderia gladioli]